MSAFAVLLHEDEPDASQLLRARIAEAFPESDHYKFSDHVYLITGPRLTSEVKEKLGLEDDENLYAAILRLNGSFSGRSWVDMWDWLKAAEEAR